MIPTYNERENISELIPKVLSSYPGIHVLVVDDDSEDGTGKIAEEMVSRFPNLHVFHRKGKRGRGFAGIEGFQWAIQKGFVPVLEMDADFSHDPQVMPVFLEEIQKHDVVIGSRFIPGGGQKGRGAPRVLLSGFTNGFLRFLFGFKAYDCTSGFRCFKKQVLQSMLFDRMISKGPSIVIEVLYHCHRERADIKEIPIIFEDRQKGQSKLNSTKLFDTLGVAMRLRFQNPVSSSK